MALDILTDQLCFGEAPRWRDGAFWLSDMEDGTVRTLTPDGRLKTVLEVESQPGGLGWMPDGALLVVAMEDRKLLRFDGRQISTHADLAAFARFRLNDMVVDRSGRAYVGDFGFDLASEVRTRGMPSVLEDHPTASVVIVHPDGRVAIGAPDMHFPNGSVISTDGRMLVVAETLAFRLTSFRIALDGTLRDRTVWADLSGFRPDGICLDQAGNIWVADPQGCRCVLVSEGGRVLEVVDTEDSCFACALGGEDGRTLLLLTATRSSPDALQRNGRALATRVRTPGAP